MQRIKEKERDSDEDWRERKDKTDLRKRRQDRSIRDEDSKNNTDNHIFTCSLFNNFLHCINKEHAKTYYQHQWLVACLLANLF